MKKLLKFGLFAALFSLCFGGALSVKHADAGLAGTNEQKIAVVNRKEATRGRVSRYLPTIVNDYSNGDGHSWNFGNSDPADGQSTDAAVYSQSIKVGMSGYTHTGQFGVTVQSQSNVYTDNYLKVATTSTTKEFRAQYVPFHLVFNVPAHYKGVYTIQYSLMAERKNCNAGSADYSAELFYYPDGAQTHANYFYHQNDFTPTTGRGFSKYRIAGGTSGGGTATVTQQYIASMTFENHASTASDMSAYFGLFCYMESSGTSANYEARFTMTGAYIEDSEVAAAVAGVNGVNVYSVSSAISAYNSSASSILDLYQNFTFTSFVTLSSANGHVRLKGYSIDLGSNHMLIAANTTIDNGGGAGVQTITSSSNYATIAINAAATLTIGITEVINTSTSNGARTILLGNGSAKVIVGASTVIRSNKIGIQIDDGTAVIPGIIQAGTYSIHVGSSTTANKNIYLYGSACSVPTINVNNVSKTNIYASNEANSTSLNKSQTITITGGYSIGNTVVRNVNSTNKSWFRVSEPGYTLNYSGSSLVYAYQTYSVTYNLTGCTQTGGGATASLAANLSFTLSASASYRLPNAITVQCASTTYTQGTQYTYNQETGAVVIYKQYITNYIIVTVSATEMVTVTFLNTSGETIHAPMEVSKNGFITMPYPDVFPAYHSQLTWFEDVGLSVGGVNPGVSQIIRNNITYYAAYRQSNLDCVDEFIGIQLHFDQDVISTSNVSDTGACRGNSGYYKVAKDVYTSTFTSYTRTTFCTQEGEKYDLARARFTAWANANGEDLNLETGNIVKLANSLPQKADEKNNIVIVTVMAAVSALTLGAFIVLKKKHAN